MDPRAPDPLCPGRHPAEIRRVRGGRSGRAPGLPASFWRCRTGLLAGWLLGWQPWPGGFASGSLGEALLG